MRVTIERSIFLCGVWRNCWTFGLWLVVEVGVGVWRWGGIGVRIVQLGADKVLFVGMFHIGVVVGTEVMGDE